MASFMDEHPNNQCGGPLHAPRALPESPTPFAPGAELEALARDLLARRLSGGAGLERSIVRRFDTSGAPGLHAAHLGQRFVARPLRSAPLELTVSPYAPPQRQISAARQGAAMWSSAPPAAAAPAAAAPSAAAPAAEASAPARVAAQDASELPSDLKALLAMHRARGNI
jgi:hypothetical protein